MQSSCRHFRPFYGHWGMFWQDGWHYGQSNEPVGSTLFPWHWANYELIGRIRRVEYSNSVLLIYHVSPLELMPSWVLPLL